MITEDYVSFETAKLLKEKGFDGFCHRYYQTDKEDVNGKHALFMFASDLKSFCNVTHDLLNKYTDKNDETILAPTINMAMKWLREIHHIDIEVRTYYLNYLKSNDTRYYGGKILQGSEDVIHTIYSKDTYEDICETALRYCLENLI